MIFITKSGSIYEYDEPNKRIRKLDGKTEVTPRMGEECAWRPVAGAFIELGVRAVITWNDDCDPPAAEGRIPSTVTSQVVKIFKDIN